MEEYMANKNTLTVEDKVINLFTYLKAMNMHRETTITDFQKYKWNILLRNIPKDSENITINCFDNINNVDEPEDYSDKPFYLKIHQPSFKLCPLPSKELQLWLLEGWNEYNNENPQVHEYREMSEGEIVYFKDLQKLVNEFEQWKELRKAWREKQILNEQTKSLFDELFGNRMELMNEAEDLELVVGNGLIVAKENPEIYHPIILKRAKFEFDAKKNVIYIMNTDANSEFILDIFKDLQVEHRVLQELASEVQREEYQPWDHFETAEFLKKAVHSFSSHGNFYNNFEEAEKHNKDLFKVIFEPVIIIRKRPDGTAKTINKIIDYIKNGGKLPKHLVDIVNGGNREVVEPKQESFTEKLAAVGGESTEILLPKQANREQLEIAKRIENYNAVVVQGPPGTGKTHTIANLLGHFLSQGKSVLVTSHTNKALRVLKDKVEKELQPLCVPVLDDSKSELQLSVEAIANYNKSSTTLENDIEADEKRRKIIIEKLKEIRTSLLRIKNEQCKNIVLNGESWSPINAAEYIRTNKEKLSNIIPGEVQNLDALPITYEELVELYSSNGKLSTDEENELSCDLPDKADIMPVDEFENLVTCYNKNITALNDIKVKTKWEFSIVKQYEFNLRNVRNDFILKINDMKCIEDIKDTVRELPDFEDWEMSIITDGISQDVRKQSWERLIEDITQAYKTYEDYEKEAFGKELKIKDVSQAIHYKNEYIKLKATDGKVSFLNKWFGGSDKNAALELVMINGQKISSAADCELVLSYLNLQEKRKACSIAWDKMMNGLGIKSYLDLDVQHPEKVALRYCNKINALLSWYDKQMLPFIAKLKSVGFPFENLVGINDLNSDHENFIKTIKFIKNELCLICDGIIEIDNKRKTSMVLDDYYKKLTTGSLMRSEVCISLSNAVKDYDIRKYAEYRKDLIELIDKYRVQFRRNELLEKIRKYAPEWSEQIRTRVGIHGLIEVPECLSEAWKWKQLNNIINKLNSSDYDSLQKEANRLSNQYHEATAKLAADRAWHHLVKRNEASTDLQQALKGWAYNMKKIGKGTGKLAKYHRDEARKKMIICQKAVPAWIMPIRKAIETLEPAVNRFDVVIVDEASQSDLTALAIAFLGKKVIIVGDDKQVSPLAVGVKTDKIKKDADMYIKDIIPNSELYTPTDSLYTIADTTFQSMMLLEHFRCVPEIIGFSNMLSYDYKIKPLREASSSNLLPAIVNYRVSNGVRAYPRKINEKEAETIVALIKSCIMQKEYANKTFGVISLLGDEQARLIQSKLCAAIGNLEFEKREIICGDSANFQGDEKDVIFLSMVDSNEGDGPLRLTADGREDAFRKRYNVAASRAKDQLWVVHSLDQDNDLKSDDIRKKLLDYARNPQDYKQKLEEIKKKADSPFEVGVANALVARGYNIVQQWPAGAYRIDMVACYGNNKRIAIECDGEQYHSADDDVLRDMERQTILERIGWTFIRIRGSEYFKNPEATIDRVVKELKEYGIMPEHLAIKKKENTSDLLERVKQVAVSILNGENVDLTTVTDNSYNQDVEDTIVTNSYNDVVTVDRTYNEEVLKNEDNLDDEDNLDNEDNLDDEDNLDEEDNLDDEDNLDEEDDFDEEDDLDEEDDFDEEDDLDEEGDFDEEDDLDEEDDFDEEDDLDEGDDFDEEDDLDEEDDFDSIKECKRNIVEPDFRSEYIPNEKGLYPKDTIIMKHSDGSYFVEDLNGDNWERNSLGQRMRYLLSDGELKKMLTYEFYDVIVLGYRDVKFVKKLLQGKHILLPQEAQKLSSIVSVLDVHDYVFENKAVLKGKITNKKEYEAWLQKYSKLEAGLIYKERRTREANPVGLKSGDEIIDFHDDESYSVIDKNGNLVTRNMVGQRILEVLSDDDIKDMMKYKYLGDKLLSSEDCRLLKNIIANRNKTMSEEKIRDFESIISILDINEYKFNAEVDELVDLL